MRFWLPGLMEGMEIFCSRPLKTLCGHQLILRKSEEFQVSGHSEG